MSACVLAPDDAPILQVCAWEHPGCLTPASKAPAGVQLSHGLCTSCAAVERAHRSRRPGSPPGATPPAGPSPSVSAAAAASLSVLPGGGGSRDSYVNDPSRGWRGEDL